MQGASVFYFMATVTTVVILEPKKIKSVTVSIVSPTICHEANRKGVYQGCILSPCLFNLCAECIMRNARLGEAQAGIKIAGRNTNNLRYADDTTIINLSAGDLMLLNCGVGEDS